VQSLPSTAVVPNIQILAADRGYSMSYRGKGNIFFEINKSSSFLLVKLLVLTLYF
jgi:hypothetical protein